MDNTFARDVVLENIPSDKSTDLFRIYNGKNGFQLIMLSSIERD